MGGTKGQAAKTGGMKSPGATGGDIEGCRAETGGTTGLGGNRRDTEGREATEGGTKGPGGTGGDVEGRYKDDGHRGTLESLRGRWSVTVVAASDWKAGAEGTPGDRATGARRTHEAGEETG